MAREASKTALEEAVGAMKTEATASEEERMRALGYIDGDCNEIAGGPVSTGASPEAQ